MFRNYLKITWRNLIKNKIYSALNIFGIAAAGSVAFIFEAPLIQNQMRKYLLLLLVTGVALVNTARAQDKAGKLQGPDIDIIVFHS
ncbi:MAG TPA: hypothetical protein VFE53_17400, partial [Mucilaginibacter sp.]|nr:hypothetical protein [Mucilaginibacter sp.]